MNIAEVAEWTIATVCKTVARKGYPSSNLGLSTMTSGKRLLQRVAPYARLIRGIDNPYRLAILYVLSQGKPLYPEAISRHVPLTQNLLAHHLRAMVRSGWLKKQRVGTHVMYSILKKSIREIPQFLADTPLWSEIVKTHSVV